MVNYRQQPAQSGHGLAARPSPRCDATLLPPHIETANRRPHVIPHLYYPPLLCFSPKSRALARRGI
jgi:hypothetical protein